MTGGTILEGIVALLKSIPILDRWFTKTTAEKEQDAIEKRRKEREEFERTGRPPK